MKKRIIIYISGGSCTGKSTVGKILFDKIKNIYLVSHDELKWQLAGYSRNKDKKLMKNLERGFLEVVCKEGIPILLEHLIESEKEYDYFLKIAKKYKYKIFTFNLVSPSGLRLSRYKERVRAAKKEKTKISVRSYDNFLKNCGRKHYVPKNSLEFDTSKSSAGQIAKKILETINKK